MKTVYPENKLTRDSRRGVIAGVCAGVARYFGIEPVWTRVGAVAGLIFLPMVTAVLYLVAVLAVPRS